MFKIKFIFYINIIYLINMLAFILLIKENNNFFFTKYENILNKFLFFFKNKNNVLILLLIIFFSGLPPFFFFFVKWTIFTKVLKLSYTYITLFYFLNSVSVYIYFQFYKRISKTNNKKNFFIKIKKINYNAIFYFTIYINTFGYWIYQYFYYTLL